MGLSIWQAKKQCCEIGHRIWLKGFCAGNEGNFSMKLDGGRFLCTPTGVSKGFMTPEDLCLVDSEGEMIESNPHGTNRTSEVKIHLAIYRHRPDITAVIHCHPPHATAFAIAGIPLPEGIYPEGEVFLGRVAFAPYATPGSDELAQGLIPVIGQATNTVLMGNHGAVCFSDQGLVDALYKAEILDAYCRMLLLAGQLGQVNTLSPDQMVDLLTVKQNFGMTDPRLACAADGCVGQENQPFFAAFDVRPATATCNGDGSVCNSPAAGSGRPDDSGNEDEQFEAMVQAITDHIMAARGN